MSSIIELYPLKLIPSYKDYLWGGDRLVKLYNKKTDIFPLAESWECSVHSNGQSIIANGFYQGRSLVEYLKTNLGVLGAHVDGATLPILIKFIDANQNLSIQVHPDDQFAFTQESGSLGKTEMWYVLSAEPDAELIIGFNDDLTLTQIKDGCLSGTIEKYLNHVPVHEDEIYLIRPGIVHAIGEGCVILEIQESSDITYRLYDYNRVDNNGEKRPLHIDKALKVLNCSRYDIKNQPLRTLRYEIGLAKEVLLRCEYFKVERFLLNSVEPRLICENHLSFTVLICIDGKISLYYGSTKESLTMIKGETVFIPCGLDITANGEGRLVEVSC